MSLDENGRTALDFAAPNGVSGRVAFFYDETQVWVDVYSRCFHLPGGYVYGETY